MSGHIFSLITRATFAISKQAEMETNRANQRTANAAASAMPNQGLGGTMLTGPQGIDPSQLMLGKNTLLGS